MSDYATFVDRKTHSALEEGFDPDFIPSELFDFQIELLRRSCRRSRAAIFADCGLGKTPIQLAWAQNVVQRENGRVLVMTPLAVAPQTIREGEKFGIECARSRDGMNLPKSGIVVTNYDRIERFNPSDFVGAVCDESSILKSFDGVRRQQITDFLRKLPYRLLCTATAAPNDWIELGTSSEALGNMGHVDMLGRFFVADDGRGAAAKRGWGKSVKFRLKGHAEEAFWRWICSWATAMRRPSDLGFEDGPFRLPALDIIEHTVIAERAPSGTLMESEAVGMREEREATRRTIRERCERAASLALESDVALLWCNLNDEGDILTNMIPGAVQVSGNDTDEDKEERFAAFAAGQISHLVTKPSIGAWGLNFQNCARVVLFPTHSFEQYYQGVRRCWRFGQRRSVKVDVVGTYGLSGVMANLSRKSTQADEMFSRLVIHMAQAQQHRPNICHIDGRLPTWM